MTNKSFRIIFVMLVFLFNFLFFEKIFAIGMVAEPLIIKDVLQDQEVSAITTVINTDKNDKVIYGISAIGEIKNWATFYKKTDLTTPINEIEVPAGSDLDFIVKFKIPNDADMITYNGEISVFEKSNAQSEEKSVQMAVSHGLQRMVSISVTGTKILSFESMVIPSKYEVAAGEPLKLKVIYTNNGNVFIRPDLKLLVTNENGAVVDEIRYTYPADLEPVGVHEEKILPPIEWRTSGIANGKYIAKVEILLDDKSYYKKEFNFFIGFNFNNYSASLLSKIGITEHTKTIVFGVIGVVLILFFAILFFFKKNNLWIFNKKQTD